MRRLYVLIVIVMVGTLWCHLVKSQPQERSVNTSTREMSGRMISSSRKGNRIHQHGKNRDNEETGGDSAFDNAPEGDSSEITFPMDDYFLDSLEERHKNNSTGKPSENFESPWKKIPARVLMELAAESDVATFFLKYVKNTTVVRDNETSEQYLADSQGKPILLAKNEKVVVTPSIQNEPALRHSLGLPTPRGRSGITMETKTKQDLDAASRGEKQFKSNIAWPACTPEVSTVPVPLESLKIDPSILVIPKCVKVPRCGGCCLSDLTVCEPATKETTKFTVSLFGYDGDNDSSPKLQLINTTYVEVDSHKSCKCKCRTKKEDCKSKHHKYEENICSCVCKNRDVYQACVDNPGNNRVWDYETCQCTCQEVTQCSSGLKFDLNSCDCQPEYESRMAKGITFNRTNLDKSSG